ncbi:MAG TPA: sulfotransferase, partial [Dokdonella sp.]
RRAALSWDGAEFSRLADAAIETFAAARPRGAEPALGSDVVLIVGLPNAGLERVLAALAAHPDASVGDGVPELVHVIQEESTRRHATFPEWVHDADADDWRRLGRHYVERIARWSRSGAVQIDATPGQFPFLGAALAMLPGARVVDCRDDALETCWYAYRRLFPIGREAYSYDFVDLARHWRDYDRLMLFWHAQHAGRVHQHDAARLAADPATALRELLAFCGLSFDADGLKARAPAAPLAAAREYGARLEPLRRLLDPYARAAD